MTPSVEGRFLLPFVTIALGAERAYSFERFRTTCPNGKLRLSGGDERSVRGAEKWFFNAANHPLRWELFFRPLPVGLTSLVLASTVAAALLWRARGQRGFLPGPSFLGATSRGKSILYSILPLIIGVHVAVPLLADGTHTELFSPWPTSEIIRRT